jgi:ribosomal-protein-alanine N-acetyltransferase
VTVSYTLRYMSAADIPQVVEVDRSAFSLPWSPRSYHFEINENEASHMLTLTVDTAARLGKLRDMLRRLRGKQQPALIIGYGGFWLIDGEHHVSTIAVRPEYRGRGLGELMLAAMLMRGIGLSTDYSVLEVRVSNTPAIRLYEKYGYQIVGRRKQYYRDNMEDAHLMQLSGIDAAYKQKLEGFIYRLRQRMVFYDHFTQAAVPTRAAS